MTIRCSVIICTFNRCTLLDKTLVSLMEQSFPAESFEIIVVDNNSTDNTAKVVRSFIRGSNMRIRYLLETEQGLSHARNRGLTESQGEFIAFIDDDATAEKNWLARLVEGFDDPSTACIGGRVDPAWPTPQGAWPDWLHERLRGFFSIVQLPEPKELHYPHYPAGTNIAFRKRALEEAGVFNPQLGRIGESLLSMEETDLCLRLERAGYRISYTPAAAVLHTIAENRLTREWLAERSRWQGISAAVIEKEFFSSLFITRKSFKYILFIAGGLLGQLFGTLSGNKRLSFFCSCQIALCRAYLRKAWSS